MDFQNEIYYKKYKHYGKKTEQFGGDTEESSHSGIWRQHGGVSEERKVHVTEVGASLLLQLSQQEGVARFSDFQAGGREVGGEQDMVAPPLLTLMLTHFPDEKLWPQMSVS